MKKLVAFSVVCLGIVSASAQSLNTMDARESSDNIVEHHNKAVAAIAVENLQVVLNDDQAQITWSTYSVEFTRGFLIEKSTNGHQYESLVFVTGESDLDNKVDYFELDTAVSKGLNYYRIRQVYADGSEYITKPVVVKRRVPETNEEEIVDEFGNFTIKVDFSGFENEETLVILRDKQGYEYFGKLYIVQTEKTEKGVRIEPTIPAGEYLITGSSNDQYLAHKLSIE